MVPRETKITIRSTSSGIHTGRNTPLPTWLYTWYLVPGSTNPDDGWAQLVNQCSPPLLINSATNNTCTSAIIVTEWKSSCKCID